MQPLYENFVKNRAWMPYLGIVPLLLAVWGALRQKRRALPWVAIGLFSFVMALGPFLRVNGVELTNIPLPYALIGDRFPLNTPALAGSLQLDAAAGAGTAGRVGRAGCAGRA